MDQEYRVSTTNKVIYVILSAVLLGLACFVLFSSQTISGGPVFFFTLMGVLGIALIVSQFSRKIVITDKSVKYVTLNKTTEIFFDDIKGFRAADKVVSIESKLPNAKKITISGFSAIEDNAGFKAWLAENFTDLDKVDFEQDKEALLNDQSLGATQEEREQKMKRFGNYAKAYSGVGIAGGFAGLILHLNNAPFTALLLIYPLLGILVIAISKGLILPVAKKNSAHYSVFMGMLLPAFGLMFLSLTNFELVDSGSQWMPAIAIAMGLFLVCYLVILRGQPADFRSQAISLLILSAVYGFGGARAVNNAFDESAPQVYNTTVAYEHISHGSRSTSYYIQPEVWGPYNLSNSIAVSSSFYDSTPVGSPIKIYLRMGFFGMSWYYVGK